MDMFPEKQLGACHAQNNQDTFWLAQQMLLVQERQRISTWIDNETAFKTYIQSMDQVWSLLDRPIGVGKTPGFVVLQGNSLSFLI